ncbi:MAG: glycoside hydrolase family 2 TIM barrel-domain containing protein [Eubacteriales bacterium]|nr:glycoside hydrolase family 2 TIM barrel-domain containing protein [Eubacteriales bacterium]
MIRIDFSDGWSFQKIEPKNFLEQSNENTLPVVLPHDAMIREERREENISGAAGGYYPGCNCIYKKKFWCSEEYAGKTVLAEFEGVMRSCIVYLNGSFVASNKYGYIGFYADLTKYLEFGKENYLEVKVFNESQPAERWYSGTGIYRPVALLVGEEIHIAADGVKISTPEVSADVSSIQTEIHIDNNSAVRHTLTVNTEVVDSKDTVVAAEKSEMTLLPGENEIQYQTIYVKNPELWSVDSPNMYTLRVVLTEESKQWDTAVEHFGIREFRLDPVYGLRLNGEPIKLRGSCIHHDHGVLGAAAFARAEERKVELSKAAGFNALRISHHPASKALLEACDRHGMLVMEETFDCWFNGKVYFPYSVDFADTWEKFLKQ